MIDAGVVVDAPDVPADEQALSLVEYQEILHEIEEQPRWRAIADSEMDYADGNQLDGELLKKQRELGLPPAVENLIGPALRAIQGYEATVRTDWRVTPNGEVGGQDVADALNYKINQAERNSKADKACSDAFETQIKCGIGWVEVSRETDPFKYPYRCRKIHRNEIHWDMRATEADLSDARWLRRAKWLRPERIALSFPDHKDMIMSLGRHGADWYNMPNFDGGSSTGLGNTWGAGRSNTLHEERWYNPTNKELCVFELWYRRWEQATVIKTPDGRVVEYDENNDNHVMAVAAGMTKPIMATVTRMRRAYWLGPHLLSDSESPYQHNHFPYVPFWGFREDATGIPYGYVRDMKYPQDSLNSALSKLRWGMSVTRTERTKGAVDMTDAQLRRQAARPDADIVLDQQHMAKPGAKFEIIRDYELTSQHYQMLSENRESINRTSGITPSFQGGQGNAQSGYQEQLQVEQSNQSLADMMDNFREGRKHLGELLLSMLIEDMGNEPQTVVITGDAVTEDRTVVINAPERDPETGQTYLSNDITKTRLMVALEDVPSTNSYRGQQLNAFSEAVKSLPAEMQVAAMPYMIALMDIPHKENFIEDIKAMQQQQTPEQIEQAQQEAIKDALAKAGNDIKNRELDLKYSTERQAAEIAKIASESIKNNVSSAFAAMQAGEKIALVPQIAPIADEVMKSAGYRSPNPVADDPEYPMPNVPAQPIGIDDSDLGGLPGDTSPLTPANPDSPMIGANQGIETLRAD